MTNYLFFSLYLANVAIYNFSAPQLYKLHIINFYSFERTFFRSVHSNFLNNTLTLYI